MTTSEVNRVYETILSIPGMNEMVKIDLKISRKNVLLLNYVIERGLSAKEDEKGVGLLSNAPEDSLEELKAVAANCLDKAGLVTFQEKLKSLNISK